MTAGKGSTPPLFNFLPIVTQPTGSVTGQGKCLTRLVWGVDLGFQAKDPALALCLGYSPCFNRQDPFLGWLVV
jgi:hypothetical protein